MLVDALDRHELRWRAEGAVSLRLTRAPSVVLLPDCKYGERVRLKHGMNKKSLVSSKPKASIERRLIGLQCAVAHMPGHRIAASLSDALLRA